MTFSTLASPGVSLQGGGGSGGGGGGTPGGSNTQIQYNSSGTFAGASGLTTNGTELTVASGTKTADAPVLNMSQTWGNGATTFTGLKLNVTDTASNAASLLMDLQVGGASRFSVTKSGGVTVPLGTSAGYSFAGGTVSLYAASNLLNIYSGSLVTLANAASSFGWTDVILTRRGAANLRFGAADAAAPVAQTLSVQSVVAGTTNTAGANLTITGSQGTGTGAGGSIIFQVAPAGSTGTAQNALATALTIDGTGTNATFAQRASFGASTVFVERESSTRLQISVAGNAFGFSNSSFSLDSGASMGFRSAPGITAALDVILARDAANTLALRNGANAQLLRVYARYDGTNDAYGAMGAAVNLDGTAGDANTLYVGSQKKGSPTALTKLAVQVDGTTRLDYNISNANQWFINGTFQSGGSFFSGGDVRAAVTGSIYWNGRTNITAPADGNLLIGNLAQTDFGRMMFGGTTSSFPALKRSSAILQARLADDSAFAGFASANMQAATAYTVATLPGTPGTGMIARVTDALAPTIGATVTGGGAAYALVNYNGANWTVIGV